MKNNEFPPGPLTQEDLGIALYLGQDSDSHCWKVVTPEGETNEAVMDQLVQCGYTPTRVFYRKVFFGKKEKGCQCG